MAAFRIGGRSSALILIVLCVRNSLMNPLSPRVGRLRDDGMQVHYCRFCICVPLFSSTRHMMSAQTADCLWEMWNTAGGARDATASRVRLQLCPICSGAIRLRRCVLETQTGGIPPVCRDGVFGWRRACGRGVGCKCIPRHCAFLSRRFHANRPRIVRTVRQCP